MRNTRVAGHGLQAEGKPYQPNGEGSHMRAGRYVGYALCSCGATSPELESDAARKRWHMAHKDEMAATQAGEDAK